MHIYICMSGGHVCFHMCRCTWHAHGGADVDSGQALAGDEAGQTSCSQRIQWHVLQGCILSHEAGGRKAVLEFGNIQSPPAGSSAGIIIAERSPYSRELKMAKSTENLGVKGPNGSDAPRGCASFP